MFRFYPRLAICLLVVLGLVGPALAHPENIARRGGMSHGPENTLATFALSIDAGVEWLEIDVWLTADDELVCFHDMTLDRTTNGTGLVYEKTLAELKLLDAGSWKGAQFAGEQIPTFREAVQLLKGQARILLDIKAAVGPAEDADKYLPEVVAILNEEGFPQEDIRGWAKGLGPALDWQAHLPDSDILFDGWDSIGFEEISVWLRAIENDFGAMFVWDNIYPEYVDLIHSYGLRVWVLNTPVAQYPTAFAMGVDGFLNTNPVILQELLPQPDPQCSDGTDNDLDGDTDYPDDAGCYGPEDNAEAAECSDGLDNDGDNDADYPEDHGCYSAFYDFESPACNDEIDNNTDGDTDYPDDAGCFAEFDQREGLACMDGLDNDGDGFIDFPADLGCADLLDTDECGPQDCGGPCGSCAAGETCDPTGTCVNACPPGSPAVCGNDVCEAGDGEDCLSCPEDCNGKQNGKPQNRFCCGDGDGQNPSSCSDSACSTGGWACTDIPTDPPCCGDFVCEADEDSSSCATDCPVQVCGDGVCDSDEDPCGCAVDCGSPPATEIGLCADQIDNDCNGLADCNDADCSDDVACSCLPKKAACSDNGECCSGKCKGGKCR